METKNKLIILGLIIMLTGLITAFLSTKNSQPETKNNIGNEGVSVSTKKGFMYENGICDKVKYLFDAVPHFTNYKDYTFESVGCFDNNIVVKYNHPTGKNYELQTILYREIGEDKFMHKMAIAGHDITEAIKVNGSDNSNLKMFENTTVYIENEPEYYDVRYIATYKNEYTLGITLRGDKLGSREQVDEFLQKYLESFDLSKLQ